MKALALILSLIPSVALAQNAPPTLTVQNCLEILAGLNALNFAGEQLGNQKPPPADAAQYKFGAVRMTIALDIAALTKISSAIQQTVQSIKRETESEIPIPPGAKDADALSTKRVNRETDELQKVLDKTCDAPLAHLSTTDLKLTENEIPVSVLAALAPIIDAQMAAPKK